MSLIQSPTPSLVPATASPHRAALHSELMDDHALNPSVYPSAFFCPPESRALSVLLHELRSPLSTISTSAALLETSPPEQQQKYLDRIQAKVQQMAYLLDNLSLIAHADAAVLLLSPVDILQYCRDLVEQMQAGVSSPPIVLTYCAMAAPAQPWEVQIDINLVERILINLLHNSIKYSTPDSPINLDVIRQADTLTISVRDWGSGIPIEDQPFIFDWLYRAQNATAVSGSGLGLAIVKQCVEAHQGEIEVRSQINHGTQVTVRLPLNLG